jgi:hypothetical protein
MTPKGVLPAALERLVASVWPGLAKGLWCRRQRRRLGVPGAGVIWVPTASTPWAVWGAERGYFELGEMDGLPYLSGLAAR